MKSAFLSFAILFLTISLPGYAQQSDKGEITFLFNDEKISLPIKSINLQKDHTIHLHIIAEQSDSESHRSFRLNLVLQELSIDQRSIDTGRCNISFQATIQRPSGEHSISLEVAADQSRYSEVDRTDADRNRNESWDMLTNSMSIKVKNILFDGKKLKLVGEFSSQHSISHKDAKSEKTIAIRGGRFEVII